MPSDAERVSQMLAGLEAEVGERATISFDEPDGVPIRSVTVTPENPRARTMVWSYMADTTVVLEVGDFGGCWELERSVADISFMVDVVRSVVAGRVQETFGPRRSRVEVTLGDGSTVVETGYHGLLPAPGWRRRGRTVRYEAY